MPAGSSRLAALGQLARAPRLVAPSRRSKGLCPQGL